MAKKKKKSRGKKILFALLALVLVFILYRLIDTGVLDFTSESETESGSEATTYDLTNRTFTDIRTLHYSSANLDLSFSYDGDKEQWKSLDDPTFPLDDTTLSSIATYLAHVTSSRSLGENTGEYGLETPYLTIESTWKNGEKDSFVIGNYSQFLSQYYALFHDVVYLLDKTSLSLFSYELEDMILLDTLPSSLSEDTMTKVILLENGIVKIIEDEDGVLYCSDDTLQKIPLTNWVDSFVSEDEMASYGLDKPSFVVNIHYDGKVTESVEVGEVDKKLDFTYFFGNQVTMDGVLYRMFLVGELGEDVIPSENCRLSSTSRILYLVEESSLTSILGRMNYEPKVEETTEIVIDPNPLT